MDRILKDQPGLLDVADSAGRTALHVAIARKHVAVVQFLLKHGAGYRIKDGLGRTAIALAAESGSAELATRFLLNISDVDPTETVAQGDADTLRLLLLGDPGEVFGSGGAAVAAAVEHRRFELIKLMLAVSPEADSSYSVKQTVADQFWQAAQNGQTSLLADYVKSGGDFKFAGEIWDALPMSRAGGKTRTAPKSRNRMESTHSRAAQSAATSH